MISADVEKHKTVKENPVLLVDNDASSAMADELCDNEYSDGQYELFKETLQECSKYDAEPQFYTMALEKYDSFDEMAGVLFPENFI